MLFGIKALSLNFILYLYLYCTVSEMQIVCVYVYDLCFKGKNNWIKRKIIKKIIELKEKL